MLKEKMIILFWIHLLISMGGNVGAKEVCYHDNYCVTLNEGEITAEEGLCLVIPCSFMTSSLFTPQYILWYKCPNKGLCTQPSKLIYTNKKDTTVEDEFQGRVSMLEPDMSRRNCSIIINDLSQSDSGSYLLRVEGRNTAGLTGYNYAMKQDISVKVLHQTPTLKVPSLKESRLETLTCTAPGLCSGSEPIISWNWKDKQKRQSYIGGNVTVHANFPLGSFMKQYSSTLTFNSTAEHHNSTITCTVKFKKTTTSKDKTLKVQLFAGILNGSCERHAGVLTCVCGSRGRPLPSISWPLLTNHSDYTVNTNVSEDGIVSSISVRDDHSVNVQCVVGHNDRETKQELLVRNVISNRESQWKKFLTTEIVTAFSVGGISSVFVFGLVLCCVRNKQKSGKHDESVEMENVADRSADVDQNTAMLEPIPREADASYSTINFFHPREKTPAKPSETTETEYSEIKRGDMTSSTAAKMSPKK